MEFWKSVDDKGVSKDIKVVISDKLLKYNGVHISNINIEDIVNMYDFYDIHYSKNLYLVDDQGNNKMFHVCIDNIFIPIMMDNLCFITGGNVPYFNNNNSMIEGTLTDPNDKDSASIIFAMYLKDPIFIDIDDSHGIPVIKINTCNTFTSDIISSIK